MALAFADLYYVNVILPDERRFLVGEAKMHMKVVSAGSIDGERKVIIEKGKAVVEAGAWLGWNEFSSCVQSG